MAYPRATTFFRFACLPACVPVLLPASPPLPMCEVFADHTVESNLATTVSPLSVCLLACMPAPLPISAPARNSLPALPLSLSGVCRGHHRARPGLPAGQIRWHPRTRLPGNIRQQDCPSVVSEWPFFLPSGTTCLTIISCQTVSLMHLKVLPYFSLHRVCLLCRPHLPFLSCPLGHLTPQVLLTPQVQLAGPAAWHTSCTAVTPARGIYCQANSTPLCG